MKIENKKAHAKNGKLTLSTETVANLATRTGIKAGVGPISSVAAGRPTHCNLP